MLYRANGKVRHISPQTVAISVGPIELELSVPNSTSLQDGAEGSLYIHLHWNQETGPSLYGFLSELDKKIFLVATSCSGIGPKVALAILAELGTQEFIRAVQTNDEHALSKVSGIGRKKAEHIIVQLRHKVEKIIDTSVGIDTIASDITHWRALRSALESLGYSQAEITQTVRQLQGSDGINHSSFDHLMRGALSLLSKPSQSGR